MAERQITEKRTLVSAKMGSYREAKFPDHMNDPENAYPYLIQNEEHVRLAHFRDAGSRNSTVELLEELERWKTARLELAWLRGDKLEMDLLLGNDSAAIQEQSWFQTLKDNIEARQGPLNTFTRPYGDSNEPEKGKI